MEPRLTDDQLEAALNDQLDPALADHPVASFFREGAAAFDSVQAASPNAALMKFLQAPVVAEDRSTTAEVDSFVPIIESASVIEPIEADAKSLVESQPESVTEEAAFRPAIQPLQEDVSQWAPLLEPVFDQGRAFPENPYELSSHDEQAPDASVYWLDSERGSQPGMEADYIEPDNAEVVSFRSAGRRTALLAAVVAAIVGGAQATGTMDLLPRRVVDMAAGYEGAALNEGRKPSDPSPEEIGDADDDHKEPVGEDMPVELEPQEISPEEVLPEDGKPNLRPVQRQKFDQSDNQDGAV